MYGIVQVHGVGGLIIATFMGGVILIAMGLARMGSVNGAGRSWRRENKETGSGAAGLQTGIGLNHRIQN